MRVFKISRSAVIKINRSANYPAQYPPYAVIEQIVLMNLRHRDKYSISINTDVLKDGKLYSAEDIAAMDEEKAMSLVNSDHCEISDYSLYGRDNEIKGELRTHYTWGPSCDVCGASNPNSSGVLTRITRRMGVDFDIVNPTDVSEARARVRCFTFFESSTSSEDAAKAEAYKAAGVYAPLIQNLFYAKQ